MNMIWVNVFDQRKYLYSKRSEMITEFLDMFKTKNSFRLLFASE